MSWHYLQASEVEFSAARYLDGIASARLKSKNTHGKSCSHGNAMAYSRNFPSGMMCARSMGSPGAALSMSCPAVSRAKTSAQPDTAQGLTESEAACGERCTELLARYDRHSHSWKTAQGSLIEGLIEFSPTLPKSGMMRAGCVFPRQIAARLTIANASGFWREKWLTPTASEAIRAKLPFISLAKRWKKHPGGALGEQIGWRVTCGLTIPPPPGHLNPEFHSWLMGFPTGWSGLQPLAMDKFQLWRRQHFAPFIKR